MTGRKAAYNSTFAIGGVSCSADSFVVAESSVLRTNFCAEKPAHRQARNRWQQAYLMQETKFLRMMKKLLTLTIFSFFLETGIMAQVAIVNQDTTVYELFNVDEKPVLITKEKNYEINEIKEFIQQNIEFPNVADDCVGKVYISMTIEIDGTTSNKNFVMKLCSGFDENAMKVVDLMNKWKPAMKNGKYVRMKILIPVSFVLI